MTGVVLVTGASGMVGRAALPMVAAEFPAAHILTPSRADLDLLDASAVAAWFESNRPALVLHLAGHVRGLGANLNRQIDGLVLNGQMALNIIAAAGKSPPRHMVLAASSAAYAHPYHRFPVTEDDLLRGDVHAGEFGYAWGNRLLVAGAEAFRRDTGRTAAVALLTNIFGPGDRFDETAHVIPALIARFCRAADENVDQVTVWGNPETTRDFLYAPDAGSHLVALLRGGPETVNIASGHERKIGDVASHIAAVAGFAGDILWDDEKPVGVTRRVMDVSRLRAVSGCPPTDFHEAIRKTIDWFRSTRN